MKIRNLLVSCNAYLLFVTPIYRCGSSTVLLMVLVYNTSYALSLKALGNEISISAKVTRIWPPYTTANRRIRLTCLHPCCLHPVQIT